MSSNRLLTILNWGAALVGAGLLLISAGLPPPSSLSPGAIVFLGALFAILVWFPVEIFRDEVYLHNGIVLSAWILLGPVDTAVAMITGVIAGFVFVKVYLSIQNRAGSRRAAKRESWSRMAFQIGSLLISLAVADILRDQINPTPLTAGQLQFQLSPAILAGLLFVLAHATLVFAENWISRGRSSLTQTNDLIAFGFLEFLPLPVALLAVWASAPGAFQVLILIGAIILSVAVLANRLSVPRSLLERRARELSTLTQISRTLSTSLDLDKLLESIQIQVTQVLNVDNFYVALYDSSDQQIWYPLAVKHGQRQVWSRRPLTDRLTDRVIQLREPILLPHHARQELARIGLPPSEDAPFAWVGVPLITSERVIGCMAVFSLSADIEFTRADLNLLTILAGQAGVAIEIALHNALLSSDVTIGQDRLSAVLNSVKEGILLVEEHGRVTLANEAAARITHIQQSDYIGRRLTELTTPVLDSLGFSAQQVEELLRLMKGPVDKVDSSYIYRLDERAPPQVVERTLVPFNGEGGRTAGWLIVLRDVTKEQQVHEARDLISETLVHDLRSPIGAVLAALDVVNESLDPGSSNEIIHSSLSIAQRSARRVLELVESMLEIARLQSGNFVLDLEPIALKPLVAHTLLDFSAQASDYGISLHNQLPETLPPVVVDAGKIQRVFNNLIDNALKFTPERGQVCLDASEVDGQKVRIQVIDTGPGVPEEYREKIFERFSQVPGRTARRRGSGLGLAYCRLAVEAHGGKIWFEPNHPQGSIFSFTLPVVQNNRAEPEN